jgi:predicted hydrocarbon binding protein
VPEDRQPPDSFSWEDLGDIRSGRPNLGLLVPVGVYRLLQYTMRDAMVARFGPEAAGELLAAAGRLAGREFCRHVLDTSLDFNSFVSSLQAALREWRVGILRLERADPATLEMTLSVAEDLDCSGLPVSGTTVCTYDEGFFEGVLEAYTGRTFRVREIDCWATGDRVCRFEAKPADGT